MDPRTDLQKREQEFYATHIGDRTREQLAAELEGTNALVDAWQA